MARITVQLEGKGAMTLNDTDHRATGGEGAVYVKKGYAIKLFLDPAHAQRTGMAEKIRALSALRHPAIVAPLGAVYDAQQAMVGFYMPEVRGVPLVKTFTNAWRDAQAFGDAQALRLVDGMREAVAAAHQHGALLVDGNEMNYLVDGEAPRLIDVDSWQIGPFKATAQMPSIKDHHSPVFNDGTDWFAWAIVSFQVLVGIHPYKGTHPDFKKSDLEARMKANASVFDPQVKLNAAVRDFACIPPLLRDWYEAVFQQGLRTAPPSVHARAIGAVRPAPFVRRVLASTVGSGTVRHEVLDTLGGPVRLLSQGWAVASTPSGWSAFDLVRRQPIPALDSAAIDAVLQGRAALLRHGPGWAWLTTDGQTVSGHRVSSAKDPLPLDPSLNRLACQGERLLVWGERAFVLVPDSEMGLVELGLDTLGERTVLSITGRWPVLVRSTQFFDGAAVMDALGAPFLVVPSPGAVTVRRAPDLHGMRVLDAYARHPDFALVLALSPQDGRTHRLTLVPTGDRWTIIEDEVTDAVALNAAINARGILVSIPEDGLLRVANTHGQGGKLVQDASLGTDQRLVAWGDGIGYARGHEVVRLSMV